MEALATQLLMSAAGKLSKELYTIISAKKHLPEVVKAIEEFRQELELHLCLVKKKLTTLQDDQLWAIDSLSKDLEEASTYLEKCRSKGCLNGSWTAKKTTSELTTLRAKLSHSVQVKLFFTSLEVLIDKDKRTKGFHLQLEELLNRSATRSDIHDLTNELKGFLKPLTVVVEAHEQRFLELRDEIHALSSTSESANYSSLETEKFLQDIMVCLAEPVSSNSLPTNEEETQYYDPFTCDLMYDPVKCDDGKTYDRFSVFKHNAATANRPLVIRCPDESLRVRLFDRFPYEDPYKILRSRRDQYRAEAFAIADADDFGEALLRLDNVLQWDPNDSECLHKRDRFREFYREEALDVAENGSSKDALAMLLKVQKWSPWDREVFDKLEMINRQSFTTTESGYDSRSYVQEGTIKTSVQPARESLPGTFQENVKYVTNMAGSDGQKEETVKGDLQLADEERERGNLFYNKAVYPGAIERYTKALQYNPKDVKAYSNRAACYTNLGDLPEALKDANKCIDIDSKFTKGYSRKGAVYFLMMEYDKAIEAYLTGLFYEKDNQALLEELEKCERAKSDSEHQAKLEESVKEYLELANEERERGNLFFSKAEYRGAIKHYTKALKYNSKDVKAYSNRAACYTNLDGSYNLHKALKDANMCIAIDPKFMKGYSRKGFVYYRMLQFNDAIEAYLTGLTYEKDNQALLDGLESCQRAKYSL